MRILIDTNILIDYFCNRGSFAECADTILKMSELGQIDAYISSVSIPNIVYILRKELDKQKTKELLNIIYMILKVYDLKSVDLKEAASLDFDDYEDALQSIAANRINADYIISRNCRDFYNSKVKAITPLEFLNKYSK